IALYALAVLARAVMAAGFPDPAYPDAFYYTEVARSLGGGQGFSVDFVWIFAEVGGTIPADPVLPIPSNAHWMPLPSILAAPFIALLGDGGAGQLASYVLVGALAAPLTWAIARDLGAPSWLAAGAGAIVAVPGMLAPFMAQPDNFGLYQPLVTAALWFGARGLRGEPRLFALAGLLAGFATLSRNDGVLVLAALGLVWLVDRFLAWKSRGARPPAIPLSTAVACVALFVLVMAPWWLRQLAVFGTISPSAASGKVLFIRDIGEWNSITAPADLGWLLGQGLGPLVASRVGGFVAALTIFVVLGTSVVLAPFAVIGAWARRRDGRLAPFYVYAGLLFAANTLAFAVHVPGGTFIHSACALVPYTAILALEGIVVAVRWIARRRATWDPDRAGRLFAGAAVVFVVGIAVPATMSVHATWDSRRVTFREVAAQLDAAGSTLDDRVMSIDAGGTKYWSGRGGVVLPNDPVDTIEAVADAYDIAWLVLDRRDTVASMVPVLDRDERPDWIGPAIWTSSGPDGRTEAGLYPVCLEPDDARCATEVATR
ncbi:MAG TPA: glycosyltransferase family 39 protein, partial [Candidatus Limnocylindrales bacterium]|nr:glycosyltransferase family 39 protein [Candidatus Limnocylindrales bacterium]